MPLSLASDVVLRSGLAMPQFGLGTWLATEGDCKEACLHALKAGYRLLDTATMYNNEEQVGAAVRDSGLARDKVFVVSKLPPDSHGRDQALAAIDQTLEKLGCKTLDLWLMHSPSGGKVVETWKAMLEAKAAGKVRAVGVSNFGPGQLEGLRQAGLEAPEVNQIELHVWLQQKPTVDYCKAAGIAIMAYCPLARCKQFGTTKLADLAAAHGRTEAEMAVRWCLERGFITIPKSTKPARIAENAAFGFELGADTMARMAGLDCGFKASAAVNAMDRPWSEVA